MQAIVTRFHGPTDHHGARVSARAQAGRKYYPWDDALDTDANHDAAAGTFARALGWLDRNQLVGGGMPDGTGNCYVLVPRVIP